MKDLLAGPPPTELPADPADTELASGADPADVVRAHPDSPAAWAALGAEAEARDADPLTVYAYARVGYHRGLDRLRRNGWKGQGPIPWEHEANRGFLCCLGLLSRAAGQIGESAEAERCAAFLRDSSERGFEVLLGEGG